MADSVSDFPAGDLERLSAGLRIMALRALGSSDAAEEVVQETLARIVAVFRDGKVVPQNLAAFTHGIARHVIADTHRARERDAPTVIVVDELPHGGMDALAEMVSSEEKERVRRALKGVPDGDREILRLAFFEGLRSREIAERLGEPGERVRKRKQRALERLRQAFLSDAGRHETASRATYKAEGR